MKFLFWNIYLNKPAVANMQWLLFKWFGIHRNIPCGRNKKDSYLCCSLLPTKENSIVINEGDRHEVICRVCGSVHMSSNRYIDEEDIMMEMSFE